MLPNAPSWTRFSFHLIEANETTITQGLGLLAPTLSIARSDAMLFIRTNKIRTLERFFGIRWGLYGISTGPICFVRSGRWGQGVGRVRVREFGRDEICRASCRERACQ